MGNKSDINFINTKTYLSSMSPSHHSTKNLGEIQ